MGDFKVDFSDIGCEFIYTFEFRDKVINLGAIGFLRL